MESGQHTVGKDGHDGSASDVLAAFGAVQQRVGQVFEFSEVGETLLRSGQPVARLGRSEDRSQRQDCTPGGCVIVRPDHVVTGLPVGLELISKELELFPEPALPK